MQKGDFIQVSQIASDGSGLIFRNIINLNTVKRIAFDPANNKAEVYFHLQANISKKDAELEDMIDIKVTDVEKFLKKINHLILTEEK